MEGEFDWLDLSIPTGMLELSIRVDYPLHYATNPWLEELDDFLADLGRDIYETASFRLGIIGEEVSGLSSSEKLTKADCEQGGFLIPRPLWDALSPRCGHRDLSVDLVHVPYKGAHMEFGS